MIIGQNNVVVNQEGKTHRNSAFQRLTSPHTFICSLFSSRGEKTSLKIFFFFLLDENLVVLSSCAQTERGEVCIWKLQTDEDERLAWRAMDRQHVHWGRRGEIIDERARGECFCLGFLKKSFAGCESQRSREGERKEWTRAGQAGMLWYVLYSPCTLNNTREWTGLKRKQCWGAVCFWGVYFFTMQLWALGEIAANNKKLWVNTPPPPRDGVIWSLLSSNNNDYLNHDAWVDTNK